MMRLPLRRTVIAALVLLAVLALPPVMAFLQSRMALQMLVQVPLLIAVGYLLRDAVSPRVAAVAAGWNRSGVTGLVLASLAGMFWMLPRSLDAAVTDPWMNLAKFASVPLLIGLPMGLSWPRMGFVVRGVFLLELIATLFRLGWLYMVSPIRLCNSFLLGDQQLSGKVMLIGGGVLLAGIVVKLIWGRFEIEADEGEAHHAH